MNYQFHDQNAVAEELARGRELAAQLQTVLAETVGAGEQHRPRFDVLMEEVTGSFSRALNVMSSQESRQEIDTQLSGTTPSTFQDNKRGKTAEPPHSGVDWNPGNRRREYPNAHKVISATPLEDGYHWKKYGEKKILGAKYPRSYFKCSQKRDQGCQAIKQVQRTQDDPPMFLVTYVGQHTCTNALYASQTDAGESSDTDQFMLSFESGQRGNQPMQNWPSSPNEFVPMNVDPNYGHTSPVDTGYACPTVPVNDESPGIFSEASINDEDIDIMLGLLG